MSQEQILNRHIARCLDDVEALCPDIPSLAKVAIKREMRFLADDILQVKQDESKGENPEENKTTIF